MGKAAVAAAMEELLSETAALGRDCSRDL